MQYGSNTVGGGPKFGFNSAFSYLQKFGWRRVLTEHCSVGYDRILYYVVRYDIGLIWYDVTEQDQVVVVHNKGIFSGGAL